MMYGLEIEPGDLVGIAGLGDDFIDEVFKITQTTHGVNYAVQFVGESMLRCSLVVTPPGVDPYWAGVVLLLGFEDVDGSKGAPGLTDESTHNPKGTGSSPNASQVDTAQFKFGASSLWVNGASPTVIYSQDNDWLLSSANSDQFTVECWLRLHTLTPSPQVKVMVGSSLVNVCWYFGVYGSGTDPTFASPCELVFGF